MNWTLFASTFALIFISELPDKTALAALVLATRGKPIAVFIGAALAFVIQSLIAVTFGSVIGLLPSQWVHVGAGILFLVFAFFAWRRESETGGPAEGSSAPSILNAFLVIFVAEWGDLTQLATASLAARYHAPVTLFTSATLALWSVTALAVFAGSKIKGRIHPKRIARLSALIFAGVGVFLILDR